MYMYTRIHSYIYIYICIYIYACIYIYMYICVYVYTYETTALNLQTHLLTYLYFVSDTTLAQ